MTFRIHTRTRRPAAFAPPRPGLGQAGTARLGAFLSRYSITWLRVSLGLVIVGFGGLKSFPGASPAASLVVPTTRMLTFGLVTGRSAMVATALLECFIGLTLLTGIGLRVGLVAMAGWLVGIMSPVVLMPGTLFPHGLPTIEAQYVLKDITLAAAGAVVAARALGARLTPMEE